jgi:hypothetical protein
LAKLKGRRWNAVVDTCGYLPRTVRASAEALSDSVDTYVFISSQSVYADVSHLGVDEAVGAGLSFRSLNETIRDTLSWHETNREDEELKAGIDADKERSLLRKWHETVF